MGEEEEKEDIGVFDEEEIEFSKLKIEPLVNEPYSYENILNNPIMKPIAEADRSISDLKNMRDPADGDNFKGIYIKHGESASCEATIFIEEKYFSTGFLCLDLINSSSNLSNYPTCKKTF